jgi:dTDP-4-dehydrorhamnose 3,5-epimerase
VLIANLPIAGAFIITPQFLRDERGFFARLFDGGELAKRGAHTQFAQHSVSFNERRGTLRGLHYQASPHAEAKLVRCTAGAVHDVIVDLRAGSPTLGQAASVQLSFENRVTLYVPEGVAHGFLTLEDNSEVFYQISVPYEPQSARGICWNDAAFKIEWPFAPVVVSERDSSYPDYEEDLRVPVPDFRP